MDLSPLHLGLQIDPPFLRAALLSIRGKTIQVLQLKETLAADPSPVKQLYSPRFKGEIVSGLSAKEVLIRYVELDINKTKHAKAVFLLQHEGKNPFRSEDTLTLVHDLQCLEKKTGAFILSVLKKTLTDCRERYQQLGIEPDRLSAYPFAQVHYARCKHPHIAEALLIDFGAREITCTVMEKGRLARTYATESGIEALAAAWGQDQNPEIPLQECWAALQSCDICHFDRRRFPRFAKKLEEMKREIENILHCLSTGSQEPESSFKGSSQNQNSLCENLPHPRPILCTGMHEALLHFKQYLFPAGSFLETAEDKFGVAIGLAIGNARAPLQLLREQFFPEKHWRKSGLHIVALILGSLGISSLLLMQGLREISIRERKIEQSIAEHLRSWNFPEKENSSWFKRIEAENKQTPYLSFLPNVSEILRWLSEHPVAQQLKEENDPIQLLDFHYFFEKYPKIGSLGTPYVAKVELEFSIQDPMHARQFHEALVQGDAWVDASKEVTWETFSSHYKTTFFLKKKKI